MFNNHYLIFFLILCFVSTIFNVNRKEYGVMLIASIIFASLCGITLWLRYLGGQPVW